MANISIPNPFQRNDAFPLDATSIFSTYAQLTAYASNINSKYPGIMYPGQICAVSGAPTTAYIINSDFTVTALTLNSNINSISGLFVQYTDIDTVSSNWNNAYTLATGLTSLSSNWQSAYTTLCGTSSNWNNAYTLATGLSSISSSWVTYSNLNTGIFVKYTDINATSGNWNTAYTLTIGLTSLSSNWQSTYTTLCSTSANWNNAYTLATGLTSLSSNWQSTYTTLCTTSANWNTAYTLATGLTSLSSNWQSTYTTLCSNSGNWNNSYTLVQNNSASWNNALSSYAFIANGSVSIFNLSSTKPFTNAAGYIVSMNGAIQTPNTDFTITYSGTNYLNLNFTPRAGALIDVQVLGNGVVTNSSVVTVSASTYNPLYTYVNSNFSVNPPTGNYMVDTTTSGVTGTLPTTPALGTVVGFMDPYYTWATNNFVLSAPVNIENQNQPVFMNIAGFSLRAVYVGGNYGWRLTQ